VTVIPASDPSAREQVADDLREGRLAVLPTDTIYAVVAEAFAPQATRRLIRARGLGRNRPLTVLIRSQRQVVGLAGDVSEAADRLIAAYWPGPLTLILRAAPSLNWDLGNNAGTVALRIPTDELVQSVIKEVGPLASSAANRKGGGLPTTVEGAREQLETAVSVYVDGGERAEPVSTIVDASRGDRVEVLREGAIPAAHVARVAAGELDWGTRPDETAAPDEATEPDEGPAPDEAPAPDESPAPDEATAEE
jgi:L-threonylcarbamoyladenylate synthase